MKKHSVIILLLSLCGGLAMAADESSGAAKAVPIAKPKHKKDCVEVEGKPCHLHDKKHATTVSDTGKTPVESKEVKPVETKVTLKVLPAIVAAPVAAAITPETALVIAKKSDCFTCHAIDKKVIGPAWKDVATKYRSDATAEERLVSKIAKGGSGSWGTMPMPAHPQLNEADRRILAKFVLNLK